MSGSVKAEEPQRSRGLWFDPVHPRPLVSFTELIRTVPDAPWDQAWHHRENSIGLACSARPRPTMNGIFSLQNQCHASPALNEDRAGQGSFCSGLQLCRIHIHLPEKII